MVKTELEKFCVNLIPCKKWRKVIRESLIKEGMEYGDEYIRNQQEKFKNYGITIEKLDDFYYLEYNDLKIKSSSWDIAYIANEIICDGCYDFVSNTNDIVMFDIGANVGTASLYFSRNKKVKKIFAFEALEPTAGIAEDNIKLNDSDSKIQLFNFGLSSTDESLNIPYERALTGSMSSVYKERFCSTKTYAQLKVKEASQVLYPLMQPYFKTPETIFFKIDCEGAEFEILPILHSSGLLKHIDIMIMEYHELKPDKLLDILELNNFTIFIQRISHNFGIIRAINRQYKENL